MFMCTYVVYFTEKKKFCSLFFKKENISMYTYLYVFVLNMSDFIRYKYLCMQVPIPSYFLPRYDKNNN